MHHMMYASNASVFQHGMTYGHGQGMQHFKQAVQLVIAPLKQPKPPCLNKIVHVSRNVVSSTVKTQLPGS